MPPVISGVGAAAGVGNAVVSWTTSKAADSLVQYGESTIFSYTAYDAKLITNHVMTLSGLQANRDYYYQVTSRDAAGNSTVNDNSGALYSFTNRRAPQPPWFDNLESGTGDWTVVADPSFGSDVNWTLGTPEKQPWPPSAYSGTNAWGSNLKDQPIGFIASSYSLQPGH